MRLPVVCNDSTGFMMTAMVVVIQQCPQIVQENGEIGVYRIRNAYAALTSS
ncbi:MAG TPA: hypothetical protein VF172_05060 [Nitrososphaera sp.]|jgi:hypothetical protein